MLAAPAAFAQDRYIADKLFTYMHSGPNNTFRIIGSVDAGEKITYLTYKLTRARVTPRFKTTAAVKAG